MRDPLDKDDPGVEILARIESLDSEIASVFESRGLNSGTESPLTRIADALEGMLAECQRRRGTATLVKATEVTPDDQRSSVLQTATQALVQMASEQKRLADHLIPAPEDIVGTDYIAGKLRCSPVWVARMAAKGDIPKRCIVQGTGGGKTWKFHRRHVEDWLATRNVHLTGQ